eukprot:jgi/Galph1/2412/GphlegSOOS_G1062.1
MDVYADLKESLFDQKNKSVDRFSVDKTYFWFEPNMEDSSMENVLPTPQTNIREKNLNDDLLESDIERVSISKQKNKLSYLKANVIGTGLGYFAAGYQFTVLSLLNEVWATEYPNTYTSARESRINDAFPYGVLIGLVLFAILCDIAGRKSGLVLASLFNLIGAILCTAAYGKDGSIPGMFWCLTIGEGIAGVGAGGEFPCGMVNTVEDSEEVNAKKRGARSSLITTVMDTIGNNATTVVTIIFLRIFGTNINGTGNLEPVWRLTYGFVILVLLPVFLIRLRMSDSALFLQYRKSWRDIPYKRVLKSYWLRFICCAGIWFFLLGLYSGLDFFGAKITHEITGGDLMLVSYYQLVLWVQVGFIFIAAFLLDILGRRWTLLIGLGGLALCLFLIAGLYYTLEKVPAGYIILNAAQNGFQKVAYCAWSMLTSEIFPTPIRSTAYGFAWAIGEVSSIIFVHYFLPIAQSFSSLEKGYRVDIFISASMAVVAFIIALFVPEPSRISLREEEQMFLRENSSTL